MFNPQLSELQFLLLFTALLAGGAGFALRAWLLPWLRRRYRAKPRYFRPHPYLQRLQRQDDAPFTARKPSHQTDKPA